MGVVPRAGALAAAMDQCLRFRFMWSSCRDRVRDVCVVAEEGHWIPEGPAVYIGRAGEGEGAAVCRGSSGTWVRVQLPEGKGKGWKRRAVFPWETQRCGLQAASSVGFSTDVD